MATVYLYASNLNMHAATVWYGTVVGYNASEIVISNGVDETIYTGNFTYDGSGVVYGTLTGVTEINNGAYAYVATGLDVNATVAEYYIQSGNALAFLETALTGNDQFVMAATGTHLIDGYGGYNTVYENGPRSSFVINGAGNKMGVGENDTLYNIQGVYFTDGFLNLTDGLFSPTVSGGSIVFQNNNGSVALWDMNGTSIIGGGLVAYNPGPTWHIKGEGHFYFGDGTTDIVLQNNNGTVELAAMDGVTVLGGGQVAYNPGPTWHVEGTGDFFGGVNTAIVFQNNNGSVALWDMSGTSIIGGGVVAYNPGPTWHIEGTGDFYKDGHTAILFQNNNGAVAIWDMNGTSIIGGGVVTYNPGPTWHIKGTGDFYGDGNTDILWQNDNGTVAIWDMRGTSIIGGGQVANPGRTWHIEGTGDFYKDGRSDILWQNDNGTVAIWDINGTSIIGGGEVAYNPGSTWHVENDRMQFITSAAANETLTATPSSDEFVFTSYAPGDHTITGFNPVQDIIEFNKAQFSSFAQVEAATTAQAGGSLINLGNGSLLLAGVNPALLHASDFAWV